jgi:hypothetical protein
MSASEVLATIEALRAERDEARRWARMFYRFWQAERGYKRQPDLTYPEVMETGGFPGRTAKVIRQGTPVHSYSDYHESE